MLLAPIILYLRHSGASQAATRHGLWLMAFGKFAIPTPLLAAAGASLASLISFRPARGGVVVDVSRLLLRAGGNRTVVAPPAHPALAVCLFVLWFAGSAILLVTWMRRLRRSALSLMPPSDAERTILEKAKQRLGVHKDVRLGLSKEAPEPLLRGIVRSTLVLPSHLSSSLSSAELEAVILHELAHLRRRDNLLGSIAHLISLAFWFHPLL
jgi:beta-lactamase regulating signal transducer with metallopeptidase domain